MIQAVLALFLMASPDEVELTDGTLIEGKVQETGDTVRVTRSGGTVTFPRFLVKRIEYKKTPQDIYLEKAAALKDDDLEGRLRLARWCATQRLQAEARAEYAKVIAAETDHEEARAALGYRRQNDKWMTEDEINAGKGLVRHHGRWMTPEERDLDQALQEQKDLDRKLAAEVRKHIDRLHSADLPTREEAQQGLSRIDDKHKAAAFLNALKSPHKETRRFLYEELARMKEPKAARPLARRAIWDEEESLRLVALRALTLLNHPDSVLYLLPFLGEESTSARIRTAEALSSFKDLRSVGPLIEALENAAETLQMAATYGDQVTAVVNRVLILRDGTRILLPKLVRIRPEMMDRDQRRRLEAERAALAFALYSITGQNLGDNVGAWRAWIDKKKSGKE